ncbi:MAG: hypothetical protein GXO31_02755 [Epsilonproteobacteria bacterium]|nr:hypothetical protein [Campylobacterota bacterium]
MFLNWFIITVCVFIFVYLLIMLFYTKSLLKKEKRKNKILHATLDDAEIMIRKYQIQLQRALGDIDLLNNELNKVKNDIKTLRLRNSQYRVENEKLNRKIEELEGKIEALL